MQKTWYLFEEQTSEYRNTLKILMQKLGVKMDDEAKFDSGKDERITLTVNDEDTFAILNNMNIFVKEKMQKILLLEKEYSREHRYMLKILMQNLGVEIDDKTKFDSDKEERVIIYFEGHDMYAILEMLYLNNVIVWR